jgi:glucosamine-phosphate N-acetyltransferase
VKRISHFTSNVGLHKRNMKWLTTLQATTFRTPRPNCRESALQSFYENKMTDDFLFDQRLLPPSSAEEIFRLRPLSINDKPQVLACLDQLSSTGKLSEEDFIKTFNYWKATKSTFCVVIEEISEKPPRLCAVGTIFFEQKLLHQNGIAGHIEDIVTHSDFRGKGLGLMLIEALILLGRNHGCYKIILDCSESNAGFYEKLGFIRKGIQMYKHFSENDKTASAAE